MSFSDTQNNTKLQTAMYGQNFVFPNFKPGGMDSKHYYVNVYLYKPTLVF